MILDNGILQCTVLRYVILCSTSLRCTNAALCYALLHCAAPSRTLSDELLVVSAHRQDALEAVQLLAVRLQELRDPQVELVQVEVLYTPPGSGSGYGIRSGIGRGNENKVEIE